MVSKKNFWFKFEMAAWLGDKALLRCSFETRGFWIQCIAIMEDEEVSFLEGTPGELANLIGCQLDVFERSVAELQRTKAAEIAKSQDFVKIVSRRLVKRYNLREYNRIQKQKEREKRNVKVLSNECSKDIEIKSLRDKSLREEKKEIPPTPLGEKPKAGMMPPEIHTGVVISGVLKEFGLKKMSHTEQREWVQTANLAFENDFSPDQFLECLHLLRKQNWRTSAVKPKHVFENLPDLNKLRNEQRNGTNGQRSGKDQRTDTDVLSDSAAYIREKYSDS
jgi:hypothetical protein